MPDPNILKNPIRRDPAKSLHILVMNAGGWTKRLNISVSFIRIILVLSLITLLCLGVLAYFFSTVLVERDRLAEELRFTIKYQELVEYNRFLGDAPEQARLILEQLDKTAHEAYGHADQPPPAVVEKPEESPPVEPVSVPVVELPVGEEEVWSAFKAGMPAPTESQVLEVDSFNLSPTGQFSFVLLQAASPGQRVKGRTIVLFAVTDQDGQIRLLSYPEIDVSVPEQGYQLGTRYNMISSKVVRGEVKVPVGGKILSVEVLAWDEDDGQLVMDRKVAIKSD